MCSLPQNPKYINQQQKLLEETRRVPLPLTASFTSGVKSPKSEGKQGFASLGPGARRYHYSVAPLRQNCSVQACQVIAIWLGVKNRVTPQWLALVNGNVDYNLRSPGGLNLTQTHIVWVTENAPTWENQKVKRWASELLLVGQC